MKEITMDSKKKIIDLGIKEIEKALSDLQKGKAPKISRQFKKVMTTLSEAEIKLKENKITEEELNTVVDELASRIKDTK
jgi:chaperonin cofactor prefoldin